MLPELAQLAARLSVTTSGRRPSRPERRLHKPTNQNYSNTCGVARVWVEGDADKRLLVYCASEALTTAGDERKLRRISN